jgi:hypothetical protein
VFQKRSLSPIGGQSDDRIVVDLRDFDEVVIESRGRLRFATWSELIEFTALFDRE